MKQLLRIYSLKTGKVLLAPVYTNGVSVRAYHHRWIDHTGQLRRMTCIPLERRNESFYEVGYRISQYIAINTKDPLTNRLTVNNKEWV